MNSIWGAPRFSRFIYRIGKPVYKFFKMNRIPVLHQFAFSIIRTMMTTQCKLELSLKRFAAGATEAGAPDWVLIRDVEVTGGSRLITKNDIGYISSLQNKHLWKELGRYKLQEEAQMLFHIDYAKKLVSFWRRTNHNVIDGKCFSALSPFSKSWVHWLFEMLPQLLALSKLPDSNSIQILIEINAPAQIRETITLFFPEHNIIEIPDREQAQCYQLLCYDNAELSWSVLWTRDVHDKANEHYSHNLDALKCIRQTVYTRFGITDTAPEKNLFIRRKAAFRFIHNEQELTDLLIEKHFTVIEPSIMTFREQVESFSNTKMIVAQAGAALANIIFMKPGSCIVCLAADSPFLNYSYFQTIAEAFGVKLYYVLGTVDNAAKYCHTKHLSIGHPLNASFTIDTTKLNAVLMEEAA